MNRQNIFPSMAFSAGSGEATVKLEGQKVVFDKKVSLLPADIRRGEPPKIKEKNGREDR